MANVIDSLVVSLGLDPRGFTQGQKDAVNSLRGLEQQSARTAKELEARGKQAAQFYAKIRNEVLALGATFFGARGIEEFTRRMTIADAATGRMAVNLGTSVGTLGTWQNAARLAGNSADDATSSMQSLVSQFQKFSITGEGSFPAVFRALGIEVTDGLGHLKDFDELLKDLGAKFQTMTAPAAQAWGSMIGLTPGMVNTLRRSRTDLDDLLDKAHQMAPTQEDTDAAQRLQKAWEGLRGAFDSTGRTILTETTPALSELFHEISELLLANKAEIGENVKEFVLWLKSVDWKAVGADVKEFGHSIDGVAKAVGGWVTVGEIFLALWGGAKMIAVIERVIALAGAVAAIGGGAASAAGAVAGGAAAATGAGAVAATVGTVATIGFGAAVVAGAMVAKPGTTNAGEDEFMRAHPELFPFAGGKAAPLPRPKTAAPRTTRDRSRAVGVSSADVDALTKLHWTREQAIGILANLQQESSGNPGAIGDGGAAYGLGQWHPKRQEAFKKWSGHDIRGSSRDEQLRFIDYELREGGEQRAGNALKQTTTAEDAAKAVSRYYERPGAADAEAARRAALATQLSPLLTGAQAKTASAGPAGGSTTTIDIGTVNVTAPAATDINEASAQGIAASLKRFSWLPGANQGLT